MPKLIFACICLALFLGSCTEDIEPPRGENNRVQITTSNASSVTANSVTAGGSITSDGGNIISQRGIVYSSSSTKPTLNNFKTAMGSGTGSFSGTITGLNANTVYYFRAYATNALGNAYGEVETFRTMLSSPNLTSPSNSVQVGCCNINFQWASVNGATEYELQVARNSSFTGTIRSVTSCAVLSTSSVNMGTSTFLTFCMNGGNAANNGLWYWRVRAKSATNIGGWSSVRSFNYSY